MKPLCVALLASLCSAACDRNADAPEPERTPRQDAEATPELPRPTLAKVRAGFVTTLVLPDDPDEPVPAIPPDAPFTFLEYDSAVGTLGGFVSKDPGDGKKHPAIVWITGGDTNGIWEIWEPMPASNDQTARQYRDAGVVMLFPGLRGGNDFPGRREGFFGEVDDVIAATQKLRTLPYVDPDRIYLGGHSTGGTLALLVAESSDLYRAAFSFGPVHDPDWYGGRFLFHDPEQYDESLLRAPVHWLHSIRAPTFVIEGQDGNWLPLHALEGANENPLVTFIPLRHTDHFAVLAPLNTLIAAQILADTGPSTSFTLSAETLQPMFPG